MTEFNERNVNVKSRVRLLVWILVLGVVGAGVREYKRVMTVEDTIGMVYHRAGGTNVVAQGEEIGKENVKAVEETVKPVEVEVKEEKSVEVEVKEEKPVEVKVEEEKSVEVKVEEEKSVEVKVEEEKPVEVKEEKPVEVVKTEEKGNVPAEEVKAESVSELKEETVENNTDEVNNDSASVAEDVDPEIEVADEVVIEEEKPVVNDVVAEEKKQVVNEVMKDNVDADKQNVIKDEVKDNEQKALNDFLSYSRTVHQQVEDVKKDSNVLDKIKISKVSENVAEVKNDRLKDGKIEVNDAEKDDVIDVKPVVEQKKKSNEVKKDEKKKQNDVVMKKIEETVKELKKTNEDVRNKVSEMAKAVAHGKQDSNSEDNAKAEEAVIDEVKVLEDMAKIDTPVLVNTNGAVDLLAPIKEAAGRLKEQAKKEKISEEEAIDAAKRAIESVVIVVDEVVKEKSAGTNVEVIEYVPGNSESIVKNEIEMQVIENKVKKDNVVLEEKDETGAVDLLKNIIGKNIENGK